MAVVSVGDREYNPNTNAILLLKIPSYLSELFAYGMRPGRKQYWEGCVNLPPKQTRVVKLRREIGEPDIYGVPIGRIRGFWGFGDGVRVFYGWDRRIYVYPRSS